MLPFLRQRGLNQAALAGATPFTPASLAGLTLWLKADGTLWQDSARTTAATADGDPVGAWDDAGGSGNHATQATGSARPTLKLAVQNGLPVIRFDGVDDFLNVAVAGGSGFTLFFVVRPSNNSMVCGGTSSSYVWVRALSDQINTYFGGSFRDGAATGLTSWHQYTCRGDGVQSVVYVDGPAVVPAGADAGVLDLLYLGKYAGDLFHQGDTAEVLYYDSALSGANFAAVESYLKARWGTP